MPATRLYSGVVHAGWLDELNHMNFLEYQRLTDKATNLFWTGIGGEPASPTARLSFVMIETHASYRHELRLGDSVVIDTCVIGYDHRRFHLHHSLRRGDEIVTTVQGLFLAFDAQTRRAGRWTQNILDGFAAWPNQPGVDPLERLMPWGLQPAMRGLRPPTADRNS